MDARAIEAMYSELHGLRELIEVQLGSIAWGQEQSRRPQQAGLWRRLQRLGLPAELSRSLLDKVAAITDARQAWRMVLAHLAQAIKVTKNEPLEEGGVIALVGPAGVGKTTTLAARCALCVEIWCAEHRTGKHGQLSDRRAGAAQDPRTHP